MKNGTNARGHVRLNGTNSEKIVTKVCVHQLSVFIIVHYGISSSYKGCPNELLYADDLLLITRVWKSWNRKDVWWPRDFG